MSVLMPKLDKQRIIDEYGTVKNFAKQNELNMSAVYHVINSRKKIKYFLPNSQAEQAYHKIKELGYMSVSEM